MHRNAHAFLLFTEGIPIVYYGAEQGMRGQRDPLWVTTDMGQDHEMYRMLRAYIQ